MPKYKLPTLEDVKAFLTEYGWHYQESTADGDKKVIVAPISPNVLQKEMKGIFVSFHLEGEFVMVSTVGFMKNVPSIFSKKLLELNDTIKCVKIFSVEQETPDKIDADVGFELWQEAWNKDTFFSFMDALCLAVDLILETLVKDNITHDTDFVNFT